MCRTQKSKFHTIRQIAVFNSNSGNCYTCKHVELARKKNVKETCTTPPAVRNKTLKHFQPISTRRSRVYTNQQKGDNSFDQSAGKDN